MIWKEVYEEVVEGDCLQQVKWATRPSFSKCCGCGFQNYTAEHVDGTSLKSKGRFHSFARCLMMNRVSTASYPHWNMPLFLGSSHQTAHCHGFNKCTNSSSDLNRATEDTFTCGCFSHVSSRTIQSQIQYRPMFRSIRTDLEA